MYTCFIVSPRKRRKPSNMRFKSFQRAEKESINADSRVLQNFVFSLALLTFFALLLLFFFDFFSVLLSIKIEILKL
jgi:hypothetical protein